jgi:large subunit ribosomal protein L17
MIELVDYNEIYNADKQPKKKTTRRGRSKKADATTPVEAVAAAPVDVKAKTPETPAKEDISGEEE